MENSEIKVSVLVTAYNHEKFLRDCLDSMVCQKTNFQFEIIVHDDVSTDGTVEIIKEYKNKYPELIIPIFEKENQYSKNVSMFEDCLLPYSRGQYIALCEGDDRWCDKNKLQKQFDFMETHPNYVACFHNTIMHDLSGKYSDKLFNQVKKVTDLTEDYVFNSGYIHTSSYFIKRENFNKLEFGKKCWMGDFVLLTSVFLQGKIACLPDISSIYNWNNVNGVMLSEIGKSKEHEIKSSQTLIKYLEQYNKFTNLKYSMRINPIISRTKVLSVFENQLLFTKTRKEFVVKKREIIKSDEYKCFKKELSFIRKLKQFIKYHIPRWLFIKLKTKG